MALSVVTVDAALFYVWLVWRFVAGESPQVFAVKNWLVDHVTIYVALAALVPAAFGKGPASICTVERTYWRFSSGVTSASSNRRLLPTPFVRVRCVRSPPTCFQIERALPSR
jgi:hypothetical protein